MAQQMKKFDRHGRELSDDIIPDGGRISVAATFMDHNMHGAPIVDGMGNLAGHRPGFCYAPAPLHDQAASARDAYLKRLNDAWKAPEEVKAPQPASRPNTSNANDGEAAYQRYVQRIANAWR